MEILDLLEEFEGIIEGSGRIPMTGKVVIHEEVLYNYLDKFRAYLPQSIRDAEYILREKGDSYDLSDYHFAQGDVVTSIIKCAHGETVTLTLDTTLPRPYSRGLQVQGTKAMYMEDNNSLFLDGVHNPYDFKWREQWDNAKQLRSEYDHPIWQNYNPDAKAGHGGMDALVLSAFFDSVRRQTQTPIDVYDAASWMCITALSEQSIAMGGMPVAIPDFTNGRWICREPEPDGPYNLSGPAL